MQSVLAAFLLCWKREKTSENIEPEPKRKKSLSLKKQKLPSKERFAIVSSNDVEKGKEGFVPENTKRCTEWAIRRKPHFPKPLLVENLTCAILLISHRSI